MSAATWPSSRRTRSVISMVPSPADGESADMFMHGSMPVCAGDRAGSFCHQADRVPGSNRCWRSPGQEGNDQPAYDYGLDPVHDAPERVTVRPQPTNRPRGPRRTYCRPPEHPGFPFTATLALLDGDGQEAMLPRNRDLSPRKAGRRCRPGQALRWRTAPPKTGSPAWSGRNARAQTMPSASSCPQPSTACGWPAGWRTGTALLARPEMR